MNKKLENILNECIDRINRGESIEHCLQKYPKYANELQDLLRTWLNIRWRASKIQPTPEFRTRSRAQLMQLLSRYNQNIRPQNVYDADRAVTPSLFKRLLVPVIASLLAFILIGSAGTVAAAIAGNVMPDQPLYPVKLATEQVRLALTLSETDKAIMNMQIAETRSNEIQTMIEKGKVNEIATTADLLLKRIDDSQKTLNTIMLTTQSATSATAVPPEESSNLIMSSPKQEDTEVILEPSPTPTTTQEQMKTGTLPGQSTEPEPSDFEDKKDRNAQIVTEKAEKIKSSLMSSIERNILLLQKSLKDAPPEAKTKILLALEKLEKQKEFLLKQSTLPDISNKNIEKGDINKPNMEDKNNDDDSFKPTEKVTPKDLSNQNEKDEQSKSFKFPYSNNSTNTPDNKFNQHKK